MKSGRASLGRTMMPSRSCSRVILHSEKYGPNARYCDRSEAEALSIAQAGKTARPLSFQNTLLAMRATRQKAQNNSTFLYDFTLTTCRLCDTPCCFLRVPCEVVVITGRTSRAPTKMLRNPESFRIFRNPVLPVGLRAVAMLSG